MTTAEPTINQPSARAPQSDLDWKSALGSALAGLIGALVLAASIWAVYGRVVHSPLIYDDYTTLDENPSIRQLWPIWNFSGEASPLRPSPETPVAARPLVNFTLAINRHLSGLDPAGYRVTNIAIHFVAALILWALVRRTLRLDFFRGRFDGVAGILGFLSALIWALHPLNTESIAYITQRTESQMGLCYLVTMYASLRYWTGQSKLARAGWLVLAAIFCQFGALSKEMMASLPAVALLYERTFIAGSFWQSLRRSWPLYIGLALEWLPLVLINHNGPRTPSAGFHLGLPAYIWWYTQAEVLLLYLKLTFWPWPLLLHYEIPYKETLQIAWPWVLPVALLGLGTLYLVWRRTSAGFVAATVWAALSPTLVVPLVGEIVAERRMYVPLAAIVPLFVAGGYALARRLTGRNAANDGAVVETRRPLVMTLAGCAVLAVVFMLVGSARLTMYADEILLLEDNVARQPDDFFMLINLGVTLAKANRPQDAIPHFAHASELYRDGLILNYKIIPDSHKLYYNWAHAYQDMGQPDEAIKYYREAMKIRPDYPQTRYNLGLMLQEDRLYAEALEQYEETLRLKPAFGAAHCNLGALLAAAGQFEEAIPHLEQGTQLDPDPGTFVNLVDAYSKVGRRDDAIKAAESAIRLAREQNHNDLADDIEEWLKRFRPPPTK
ncbi:MAG TPA: tetratricopeptide repeat protein [Pirellulales bacterium]